MAKRVKDNFEAVRKLWTTTANLTSIQYLLEWDQETYMPKSAIEARSAQIELIASLVHKHTSSSSFKRALSKLVSIPTGEMKDDKLLPYQVAAVREWRKDYLHAVQFPASFVKKFARTVSAAMHTWSDAKRHNSFSEFAPSLEKIVTLCRKKAEIMGFKDHPYDALLSLYEPDMKASYLTPLFSRLRPALTQLLKSIQARPEAPHDFLHKHYTFHNQMKFGHLVLETMGFSKDFSRLDLSAHPFCMPVHPKDTRMTTRVIPNLPMSNIFAVIHEGGHGLYNHQLPVEHFGTPVCESVSLGIDESQSRFWETLIGHSLPFWQHFYPLLQKEFPDNLSDVPLDAFYKAINTVKASLIRIEADEVTYCLHVILRFELEKALIEGSLKVKDLPLAWNEKMREFLGVAPSADGEGCLQDIHWSMGSFGYFPTYALGNLYAAQFFTVFEEAHPQWKEKVAKGDLSFVRQWLQENIHRHGKQYSPHELVKRITGKPLEETAYVNYLEQKYKRLYSLS